MLYYCLCKPDKNLFLGRKIFSLTKESGESTTKIKKQTDKQKIPLRDKKDAFPGKNT